MMKFLIRKGNSLSSKAVENIEKSIKPKNFFNNKVSALKLDVSNQRAYKNIIFYGSIAFAGYMSYSHLYLSSLDDGRENIYENLSRGWSYAMSNFYENKPVVKTQAYFQEKAEIIKEEFIFNILLGFNLAMYQLYNDANNYFKNYLSFQSKLEEKAFYSFKPRAEGIRMMSSKEIRDISQI